MKKIVLFVSMFVALNSFAQTEKPTQTEITQSVKSAYDSVGLINLLKAKKTPLTVEDTATLARNKEHLVIMLDKTWFFNALTNAQKTELQAIIL